MKKGDFVYYTGNHHKGDELGRIVRPPDKTGTVGVVFTCAGNWNEYENYTSQRVKTSDLEKAKKPSTDLPTRELTRRTEDWKMIQKFKK